MATIPTVVISGPVGVGKTTVASELSTLLAERDVAHTFVDVDALAQTYPRPPHDRFHNRLALAALGDLWARAAAAGSRNLVLSRVLETEQGLEALRTALPSEADLFVVQLRASPEALLERVARREIGAGLDWHIARAIELIEILEQAPADRRLDTDGRRPEEIAAEIAASVSWQ